MVPDWEESRFSSVYMAACLMPRIGFVVHWEVNMQHRNGPVIRASIANVDSGQRRNIATVLH
jgi:hypothetical protein